MIPLVATLDELKKLFPSDTDDIEKFTHDIIEQAYVYCHKLYAIRSREMTFSSVMSIFDQLQMSFTVGSSVLNALQMLSEHDALRNAAAVAVKHLDTASSKLIFYNKKLYAVIKEYADMSAYEPLSSDQKKFITDTLRSWELNGLHLDPVKLQDLQNIAVGIDECITRFEHAVMYDNHVVYIAKDALPGVPTDYLQNLPQAPDGRYALRADTIILETCTREHTRIAFWKLLVNKGYPENLAELNHIVSLRDKLAQVLGFISYAQFDIAYQMAKKPERVEQFLEGIIAQCHDKLSGEMQELAKNLPPGVALTQEGKIKPWDMWFIKNYYKKKILGIDEDQISQYFELEHTLAGLISFAQDFFGVMIKRQDCTELWCKNLIILSVHQKALVCGYIVLDLYPRKHKHEYILEQPIIPGHIYQGQVMPGVTIVTAQFPRPTKSEPALLRLSDVMVFLHEFGHALHTLLGAQSIISFAGTQVDRDFVEMPSQMLEQWLWDPRLLKALSRHYKNGRKLSKKLIEKIGKLKQFDSADLLLEQCFYAMFSLVLYKEGAVKNISGLHKRLFTEIRTNIEFSDFDHSYASFDHLLGYGAKYYSYLWSRVFALDLLQTIVASGSTAQKLKAIGKRYVQEILRPGGSQDPEVLLNNFLGRAPQLTALFKDLMQIP
jgi:thimet oligopeptidase